MNEWRGGFFALTGLRGCTMNGLTQTESGQSNTANKQLQNTLEATKEQQGKTESAEKQTSVKYCRKLPKKSRGRQQEPTNKQMQKMVKSYPKETEEDRKSQDGSWEEQTRPTLKIFSLSEPKVVITPTNEVGIECLSVPTIQTAGNFHGKLTQLHVLAMSTILSVQIHF
jgi:hypothetical protein